MLIKTNDEKFASNKNDNISFNIVFLETATFI